MQCEETSNNKAMELGTIVGEFTEVMEILWWSYSWVLVAAAIISQLRGSVL